MALSTAFSWFEKVFPQLSMSKEERIAYRNAKWTNIANKISEFFNPTPPDLSSDKDRHGDGYYIVGIKNLAQRHKTDSGDNVLTQTTAFRTAGDWDDLRADAARLEFTNSTGAAVVVKECTLIGKLILRNSGMYVHDKFKDAADIERNGENAIEYSSDDIVSNAHTSNMATYLWQLNLRPGHYYACEMKGRCYWLHPGQWARLSVGGAGESEYIDSVVRLEAVSTHGGPNTPGATELLFQEVKENWKYNSSYLARTIASGVPFRSPQGTSVFWVASSTGCEPAHVYCEGADDDVIIQAMIDAASDNGGGIVHLGEGTFVTAAAIEMKSNVTLEGEGPNATIIEKNGAFHGITSPGGAGTERTNITIRNLKVTRNAADTNDKHLLRFDYTDDSLIENVEFNDSYAYGADFIFCDRIRVNKVTVKKFVKYGIVTVGGVNAFVTDCFIDNTGVTMGNGVLGGVILSGDGAIAQNITVKNITGSTTGNYFGISVSSNAKTQVSDCNIEEITNTNGAFQAYGIHTDGSSSDIVFTNINISEVDNDGTAANSVGFYVNSDNCTLAGIFVTGCSGTGILIQAGVNDTQITSTRTTSNGTNFTDNGTNTSAIVEAS